MDNNDRRRCRGGLKHIGDIKVMTKPLEAVQRQMFERAHVESPLRLRSTLHRTPPLVCSLSQGCAIVLGEIFIIRVFRVPMVAVTFLSENLIVRHQIILFSCNSVYLIYIIYIISEQTQKC